MNKVCHVCGQEKPHKSWKSYICNDCLSAGLKWCPDCEAAQPISNFHKNGNTLRGACKECECARSFVSHAYNEYYDRPEVKEQRNLNSSICKRTKYATDSDYRNKEIQRCRVRETTKEYRGYYTENEWQNTLEYFKHSCAYCGKSTKISREHINALVHGGSNTIDNVIPACISCNSSKSDDDMLTWYTKQKFYSNERLQHIFSYVASMKGSDAKCLI